MKIISGFKIKSTPEWIKWTENLKKSCEKLGYEIKVASLDGVDELSKYPELLLSFCWKYKVIWFREALDLLNDDILWIDGDCLMQKSIDFDEILKDCDVALTLRDIRDRKDTQEPMRDGYINSGVVFLKNSAGSRMFLDEARTYLIKSLYDQEAFNRVILNHSKMESYGEIVNIRGVKIKLLNCRKYNNFYLDSSAKEAHIVHFKGDGRKVYDKWAESLHLNE